MIIIQAHKNRSTSLNYLDLNLILKRLFPPFSSLLHRIIYCVPQRPKFQNVQKRPNQLEPGSFLDPYSLSKCLKYPGFIFLCPKKVSKQNPRKKTKSLNYPNTIPEFFSEFGYVQDFFYVPKTIRGKKQTP